MAEEIWIVRHGETEWSRSGQHTGSTDLELTEAGEDQARALGDRLADVDFSLVLTSSSRRARHTAQLAGFGMGSGPVVEVDDGLAEMAYGAAEGRTTAEMQAEHAEAGGWVVWDGASEGAESLDQVAERLDPLVARLRATAGRVLVIGHGHGSRVLAARWVGVTSMARHLVALGTGRVGILAYDHDEPAIQAWNVP